MLRIYELEGDQWARSCWIALLVVEADRVGRILLQQDAVALRLTIVAAESMIGAEITA